MRYWLARKDAVLADASFVTFATVQLSLVIGVPRSTFVALQPEFAETVTSGGQVISGTCVSLIVTVKVQVLLLLEESVATLVTVVVPTGKVEPDGGVETTVTLPQLSVAVTKKVTLLRLHCPGSAVSTRLLEHVTIGASASLTETSCWEKLEHPFVSTATKFKVNVPEPRALTDTELEFVPEAIIPFPEMLQPQGLRAG